MVRLAPPLGSAPARSKPVSVQRVVNMMAQKSPEGSPWPYWLVGCPGLKPRTPLPKGPVRGMKMFGGVHYAVGGDTLYRVAEDGTPTAMTGSLIPDGPVYMAAGLNQLVIVAGGNGYWINKTNAFLVRITDPDFPGASSVDYIDGYFIFTVPDSGQWFISALLDATQFDALDFATAEARPDNVLRVMVSHGEVWLLGSGVNGDGSIEIWKDTGDAIFPFTRSTSASIDRGLTAAAAATNLDNTSFWPESGIVYRAEGYTPVAVSTPEVSKAIGDCATPEDMVGFTWTQEGHVFYALRIPGVGVWVYDPSTQQWHERATFGRDLWRASCYVNAYGKHIVGDDTTGGLYELDPDTHSDGDAVMSRDVYTPPIWAEDQRFQTHRFQADYEVGVGLTTGQGSDPQAMLQWSGDGGFTWSNEHWRDLGPIGARYQRVIWRRLGQARQRVYKISVTDPVKVAFLGATMDVEGAAV